MTRTDKNLLNYALIGSALSGISIFAFKKWGYVEGVFGREASPFLIYVKSLHYFITPFLIYMIGTITHGHIKKYYQSGMVKNRRTGLMNIGFIILLVVSGQSLLIIGSKEIKYYAEIVHLSIGSSFAIMAFLHQKK